MTFLPSIVECTLKEGVVARSIDAWLRRAASRSARRIEGVIDKAEGAERARSGIFLAPHRYQLAYDLLSKQGQKRLPKLHVRTQQITPTIRQEKDKASEALRNCRLIHTKDIAVDEVALSIWRAESIKPNQQNFLAREDVIGSLGLHEGRKLKSQQYSAKLSSIVETEHQITLLIRKRIDAHAFSGDLRQLGVEKGGSHHNFSIQGKLFHEEGTNGRQKARLVGCNRGIPQLLDQGCQQLNTLPYNFFTPNIVGRHSKPSSPQAEVVLHRP